MLNCCNIAGIEYGHIPSTHITATAVRNNRLLRGLCPHCLAEKLPNDPMPTSLHDVGQTISTDVHLLSVPTPNGYTHKSNMVDHKSGHFGVSVSKSKRTPDMVDGLKKNITNVYNSHGHKVRNILTDAEGIYWHQYEHDCSQSTCSAC